MSALAIFQLVQTLEVELGEEAIVVRVELFRQRGQRQRYRARVSRRERCDITRGGVTHDVPGDAVYVAWDALLSGSYDEFIAPNDEAAEDRVIDDLRQSLAGASLKV